MHLLRYILTLFFALVLFGNSLAQRDYRFYNYTEKDGLNSNMILRVAEDGNGFMWFGSALGLSRYDGYSFVNYTQGYDSQSLKGSVIIDLDSDNDGNLWFSTETGVNMYDSRLEKFSFFPLYDNGRMVYCYQANSVFPMKDGTVRFFSEVMNELDRSSGTFHPIWTDFTDTHPVRGCFWNGDSLFVMMSKNDNRVFCLNTHGKLVAEFARDIAMDHYENVYCMLDNGNGTFYLGSNTGLFLFDTKNLTCELITKAANMDMPKSIMSLYRAKDGEIWIGTNGEELHVYNEETRHLDIVYSDHSHTSTKRLNSLTVNDMFEDSHGIMWFCTWNGLSCRLTSETKKFDNLVFPECVDIMPACVVSSLAETPEGNLAIGTDGGGVSLWDKHSSARYAYYDTYSPTSKMSNQSVLALAYDNAGNLYTGGYQHPLHRIMAGGKTEEAFACDPANPDALNCDFIKDIYVSSDTAVWLATNGGGFSVFNPVTKKFRHISRGADGTVPANPYTICITETHDGLILCGTYGGLVIYDPKTNSVKNFTYDTMTPTSLSHNWVYCVLEDSKHRIWVGTCMGLCLLNKEEGTFAQFAENAGFQNLVCNGMLEDSDGNLWIATGRGIAKFNTETCKVQRIFYKNDGVLTNNFTVNGTLKDRNGCMFFGSNEGLVYFDPSNIQTENDVPSPTLTGLLIDYKPVTPQSPNSPLDKAIMLTDEITLGYKQSTFSLQFASLGFIKADSYTYAYKLVGYDDEWSQLGNRREIDFTKMQPGSYELHIIAQNPDNAKSEPRVLKINVMPPWYWCWWSKLLYVLAAVLLINAIHRHRVNILRQQKKELERQVALRTEELQKVNIDLEEKNVELNQQSEEIRTQRDQLFSQNAMLEESRLAIEQSLANLSKISTLGKQMTSNLDLDAVVQIIMSNDVVDLADCGVCLGICYQQYNVINYTVYAMKGDVDTQMSSEPIRNTSDEITSQCIITKREVFAGDGREAKVNFKLAAFNIKSAYRFPLLSGDRVIGVLMLDSFEQDPFTEEDLANLRVIVSYLESVVEKSAAYNVLKSRNVAIQGSISYAQTIQQALLAKESDFGKYFEASIIYKPKDIVSGDFFWMKVVEQGQRQMLFASVVDCTGHGVPGAFMSIISNTVLNEIVDSGIYEPSEILSELSVRISVLLAQETTNNKDGMDMSLCRFDADEPGKFCKLLFAGAKNSLFLYKGGSSGYETVPGDRLSIAGGIRNGESVSRKYFSQYSYDIASGDVVYMTSDGIIDQSNTARKRFGRIRMFSLLNELLPMPMSDQAQAIWNAVNLYSEGSEQRDDITVLGLKVR